MSTQPKIVPSLMIRRVLNAPRDRVFDAWTDPRKFEQWLHPLGWSAQGSNDLRVGGKYKQEMISNGRSPACKNEDAADGAAGDRFPHTGEYLEIVPPERLVFTWNSHVVQNTRVTIELRDLDGKTELTLTHEFFETEIQKIQHNAGWDQCLECLVQYFENT